MMEKDKTITNFLDRIKSLIHQNDLQIVDHWSADLCAIGIQKKEKLLYISTYNYIEDKIIRYDFDLELIDNSDETKIHVLKKGKTVEENDLIQELKTFFEI